MKLEDGAGEGAPRKAVVPARPTRFPCFDGLRAIAALTVIGVHTSFTAGFTTKRPTFGRYTSRLEIGVEVFFVISGFLLYRPFVQARMSGRPMPDIRQFWIRRLKRIVPAYWVAFLVVTYLMHSDVYPHHPWDAPLIYMGFAQIYFPEYAVHGLSQAWSLCTEMSFYFFVPFYAMVLARRRRSPDQQFKAELVGIASLVAVSYAYRIPVLMAHSQIAHTMVNWLPGYIDQFALGMLLAVVSAWVAATGPRLRWLWHPAVPWACWGLAALAFWAVSNIGLPLTPLTASPVGLSLERQALYGMFAFFMVLPAVFGPQDRGLIRRFLRWKPMALIGVVSYGVYLWHESWIYSYLSWYDNKRLFDLPWPNFYLVVAALAIACATISYLVLERPILRSPWGHGTPGASPPTPAEATAGAAVAAAGSAS